MRGLYHIENTKRGSYILYIGPVRILYTIYIHVYMYCDISCVVCTWKVYIQYIELTTSKIYYIYTIYIVYIIIALVSKQCIIIF